MLRNWDKHWMLAVFGHADTGFQQINNLCAESANHFVMGGMAKRPKWNPPELFIHMGGVLYICGELCGLMCKMCRRCPEVLASVAHPEDVKQAPETECMPCIPLWT